MTDSSKLGSLWGWVLLIAVVAVIGGGWLYQREGGKIFGPNAAQKPEAPPNTDPAGQVEKKPNVADPDVPSTGQLSFAVKCETYQQFGPWLYINGRIHKDYSRSDSPDATIKDEVSLPAGKYLVELVTVGCVRGEYGKAIGDQKTYPFPLNWQSVRVTINAHKTARINWKPIATELPLPTSQPDYYGGIDPGRGFGRQVYHQKWDVDRPGPGLKAGKKWIDANPERYQQEEVRAVLEEDRRSLEVNPPQSSVVNVRLPEALGGARELNAVQIEMIVDWLKDVYFPIFAIGPPRSSNQWQVFDANIRGEAFDLMDRQERHRERVDDLKAIGRKLRQAPK